MSAVTRVAALMFCRFAVAFVILVALAGCNRESYSRSTSGFSSLDKKLFYDFRSEQPPMGAKTDAPTTRKVLATIFPAYLTETRLCRSGQIVPAILGAAAGSFSAAGLKQTAYLIDVGECDQNPARTTRQLVVFTAGSVTAKAQVALGDAILGAYDLNEDRKQELLLIGGSTTQGELIQSASLVEFDKDKLFPVEDFGQVYDDACDTALPSKSVTARVVYYLPAPPGQKPRFTVELYRAPCAAKGKAPQWTRVGGK